MATIEDRIVRRIDAVRQPASQEVSDQGKAAEAAVIQFFNLIPGMHIRAATPDEDSGKSQIVKDKAIDAVAYMNGKPVLGLQITTATDSVARYEKRTDLLQRPFIRLREMKLSDSAIPRALVFIEAKAIKDFLSEKDFKKQPAMALQILSSCIASLKLALMNTEINAEQHAINKLMTVLERQKTEYN